MNWRAVLAGPGMAVAWAGAAGAASAQTIRIGIEGVSLTYSEIDEGRRSEGKGTGGTVTVRRGRFMLEARGLAATVDPQGSGSGPAFDVLQGDLRLSYAFVPSIAIEVGGGRRKITPKFATQDVGMTRLGVRSEIPLNRISSVWARGAYLLKPRFSGGGSADLAVEMGLGVGVGTANGRFRSRAEFEFQRIDRTVGGVGVPFQMAVGRLGLDLGF